MQNFPNNDITNPLELRTRREILELFWRKGVSGTTLLKENTALVDSHLQETFRQCNPGECMTLLALGGYGRQELFPFSDIDLLLLHDEEDSDQLSRVTESVFYPLWDAGLEVGHSVRDIGACLEDAEGDFFFQVALLDARFLAGNELLFKQLKKAYEKKFVRGRRNEFLTEMIHHRNERHRRFGQHGYQLEPQIKESRGGLRDVHAMLWSARFVFGLRDLEEMHEAGLLTKGEKNRFSEAWNYLIRIRNRLHYISGRKNDRLFFEHQDEIATAFNHKNKSTQLAVESFMREVYGHMQNIAICSDLFFEHAQEVLGLLTPPSDNKQANRLLSHGIEQRKGTLSLVDEEALSSSPELLMKIFLHAAQTGLPIHYLSRKMIRRNLYLVDGNFQSSPVIGNLFLQLLQEKNALNALEVMHESGFLCQYIPEFENLKSLAQHDVYHVYTVDSHLIQAVAALHKALASHREIAESITSPLHLLFLAALIHDVGKGRGKDHSVLGSELAKTICLRLGLSAEESEVVSLLVRHHLFLTLTALQRDLEEDDLIQRCALTVGDTNALSMLFFLSIADAQSTGPTVWNDWKEALLVELYLRIALSFDDAAASPADLQQGINWIKEKITALLNSTQYDLDTLPKDYLLGFTPEEIAFHLQQSLTLKPDAVHISHQDKDGFSTLMLITKDRTGLLAKLCGVLALHNLKVLAAQIFTLTDGTVVDSIDVQDIFQEETPTCDYVLLRKDLERALTYRLGIEYRLSNKRNKMVGFRKNIPSQEVQVHFDNKNSELFTIIEVYATDQPALLYFITRTLSYFHISIYRARVGSHADQVVDVFYVLDKDQEKIKDPLLIKEIQESLKHAASQA